jgi:hypothetical protein
MVENDELLLRIKGRVALFMLTMEVGSALWPLYNRSLTEVLEMGLLRGGHERPVVDALLKVLRTFEAALQR